MALALSVKAPGVVFDDADVASAAVGIATAGYFNSGQDCTAATRIYVQQERYADAVDQIAATMQQVRVGDPWDDTTDIGPLISRAHRDKVDGFVQRARTAGANIVTGGAPIDSPGFYYPPTILDCTDAPHAPCVRQECFGPILSVIAFDTEDQALALANDTAYGLASGVFTRSLTRAHRMIRGIRAGIVWVNTYRAVSPIAPFGGHGLSGHGREGGMAAALDYTTLKAVWLRTSDDPIPDPFVMR